MLKETKPFKALDNLSFLENRLYWRVHAGLQQKVTALELLLHKSSVVIP